MVLFILVGKGFKLFSLKCYCCYNYLFMCTCHVCRCLGVSGLQKLELQVAVTCPMWVLGIKLGSSLKREFVLLTAELLSNSCF